VNPSIPQRSFTIKRDPFGFSAAKSSKKDGFAAFPLVFALDKREKMRYDDRKRTLSF
jgi:hypothetical protein